MLALIAGTSATYAAGWLMTARITARRWAKTIVPYNRNHTSFSRSEVTVYAMLLALVWPVAWLYLLVVPKEK